MEDELAQKAMSSPLAKDVMMILGELWWIFVVVLAIMVFRETIKSLVTSIMVMRSGDYQIDEVVLLEGVPARIVRMGLWKTTFYLYRIEEGQMRMTTRTVMNEQLPSLQIEQPQERMDHVL